ncbi:ABC transporter substrate-binding protein, partial [Oleiphilus sp. HI0125]
GFKAQFMGPEGVGNNDINAIAGPASEGLLVTLPPSFDKNPANADLVKSFVDVGQDASGAFVLTAYSAVQVLADAMVKTGGTDTDAMQKAMREMNFSTPTGDIQFDEKGDLKQFDFVVYNWHQDGSKTEAK